MAALRAQVILKTVSGVSEDFVTNSFAFGGPDPVGQMTGITAAIKAFYDAIRSTCLPGVIAQNNHVIKYTELPGVKPNYPILETTFNLTTAPSGAELPHEVAIVSSFQGDRAAGFPQARRRGRIYIGPLLTSAVSSGRPSAACIAAISGASQAFRGAIASLPDSTVWAVWSPSDGIAVEVTDGWVDNAFDTQRRRGVKANSRTVWT